MARHAPKQGLKRAHFRGARLPALLLLPQLAILLLFFFIPSLRALTQAFMLADPFGNTRAVRRLRQLRAAARRARTTASR